MKKTIGRRLACLRAEACMSQRDLAERLSAKLSKNGGRSISYVTISAYERGQRYPSIATLVEISNIFNVSVDYLLGLSDEASITNCSGNSNSESVDISTKVLIGIRELKKYNNEPIYVTSDQSANRAPQWGILDMARKRVVAVDGYIPIDSSMTFYKYRPIEYSHKDIMDKSPIALNKLLATDALFWIELINADGSIAGKYNGWYRHNENHTCIINASNGLTLPYEGCCFSYNAYTF